MHPTFPTAIQTENQNCLHLCTVAKPQHCKLTPNENIFSIIPHFSFDFGRSITISLPTYFSFFLLLSPIQQHIDIVVCIPRKRILTKSFISFCVSLAFPSLFLIHNGPSFCYPKNNAENEIFPVETDVRVPSWETSTGFGIRS